MEESIELLLVANQIKSFLEIDREMRQTLRNKLDYHYGGISDFFLQHGQAFAPRRKPAEYTYGRRRQCFNNAFELIIRHPDLTYCEGYAAGIIPVHHAWCVDKEDRVVEVTWRRSTDTYGYWGVKFSREIIMAVSLLSDYAGVFSDRRFALLKYPYDSEKTLTYLEELYVQKRG